MRLVAGVDGWPGGWVAVVLDGGGFVEARVAPQFADLGLDAAVVIGVDIPLGSTGAVRAADQAARAQLGSRRAAVFTPPPREVLDAPDHATANRRCRARYGRGVSAQAWSLVPKMLDVEPHWIGAPERIFEVHPELSFQAMNGASLEHSKRTWAGLQARVRLLATAGVVLPEPLGAAGAAGPDDVLDAAAAAWSAARIARGAGRSVPDPPAHDPAGRPVAIWF